MHRKCYWLPKKWLITAKFKEISKKQLKPFKGGCISSKNQEWENITSGKGILKTVEGLTLEFEQEPPS